MTKIDLVCGADGVRVLFDDILHLWFDRQKLVAVAGFKNFEGSYGIELVFGNGTRLVTEYDCPERWAGVLNAVEKALK